MTRVLNEVMYVEDIQDVVPQKVKEVRASVSYELNETTENLTLNAPLDYEIKKIGNQKYYVYGYPDKWEYDYHQGNGSDSNNAGFTSYGYSYWGETSPIYITENCGVISCINILLAANKFDDIEQVISDDAQSLVYDELEHNVFK